jgi:hypothetical protein
MWGLSFMGIQRRSKMNLIAKGYDKQGNELLCSTPDCTNEVAGSEIGESYFINYCTEHGPYKDAPVAKIVYSPELMEEMRSSMPKICTFEWQGKDE